MTENPTQKVRQKITRDLCSSILWIDDEIRPSSSESLSETYQKFFLPIATEFQKEGYLIHLHPYQKSVDSSEQKGNLFDEDTGLHESACLLARKADIIILDWHLADRDSPEHSIRILKNLVQSNASRFVVILSKFGESFASELKKEDLEFTMQSSGSGTEIWSHRSGTHLVLARKYPKGNEVRITASEIIATIDDLVQGAYPDYIHWAALEIASKLRSNIPIWLQAIPKNTDMALLQELLDAESEVRRYVPENLLEDLVYISKATELESLLSGNTSRGDWLHKPNVVSENNDSKLNGLINLLVGAEGFNDLDSKKISKLSGRIEDIPAHPAWLESHQTFIQFCENLVVPSIGDAPNPGSIYRKTSSTDTPGEEIFLCASQACDCSRNKSLILLKASKCNETKLGSSLLRHNGDDYRFDSTTESLTTANVVEQDGKRNLEGFEIIGHLRPAIAARVISRFWVGTTRPAVNHPAFARKLRAKE